MLELYPWMCSQERLKPDNFRMNLPRPLYIETPTDFIIPLKLFRVLRTQELGDPEGDREIGRRLTGNLPVELLYLSHGEGLSALAEETERLPDLP